MNGPPLPEPSALETSAPRQSPPPPLPASIGAVLALHDRGMLDARTARAALLEVRRGRTLVEVLEACGVPRSLRDKADEALRPLTTRLDDATTAALVLVPPAVAALAGELVRTGGAAVGVLLMLGGGVASALARPRRIKSATAAASAAAALALAQPAVSPGVVTGVIVAVVLVSAVSFAARPVGARARSATTGLLAAGAVEALRVVLGGPPSA